MNNKYLLTLREIEILKYLAQGFSVRDIANQLYISKNTVETHRKNIYYKLGVHKQAQAAAVWWEYINNNGKSQ